MAKITLIARQLKNSASSEIDLQYLTLHEGEIFGWNHTACAITYNPHATNAIAFLFHEFGHALLGHTSYQRDISLLKMERAAWDKAIQLARHYDVIINSELIEDTLDTYRDWLHARSLCPMCNATGLQIGATSYQCISCRSTWRVNEARTCSLRRYVVKKRP